MRVLKRSDWQRGQDEANAFRSLPGFERWQGSGEYSGGQIGFNRQGRWSRRASESEYRGESKFGFKKEAA